MNDQDPLAQLRDIYLPDAVGFWPPAPGWWILAGLLIISIVVFIFLGFRQFQQNRYRAEAQRQLSTAWHQFQKENQSADAAHAFLENLSAILKRTALTAYPAVSVNSFQNQQWLAFLDDTYPTSNFEFLDGPGKCLLTAPYQLTPQNVDYAALNNVCSQWIKRHRQQSSIIKASFKPKSADRRDQTHATA